MVHVRQVDRAVGRGRHVDRAEQRIGAGDELRSGIGVLEPRQALADRDLGAPHEAADGLGEEQVAAQVVGQAVAAEDVLAAGRGEVVEDADRHADAAHAALRVGVAAHVGRPHDAEVVLELVVDVEGAVLDRRLEVDRAALAAGVDEPHLAVVVLGQAPLAAVRRRRLLQHLALRRPAQAERVVGAVDPVVHRPDEAARLVLEVLADAPGALVEQLLLVGDAVVVGVGVLVDLVGVRLHRQDGVAIERRDEARRGHVVDEHGVAVVDAVTLRALVHADAAGPLLLGGGVRVEHVAAQLGDEHPPVAVERDRAGADDLRLRHHQLEVVARRQDEAGLLLLRRERLDRLLRREVGADLARSDAVDAAALAGAGDRRPPRLAALRHQRQAGAEHHRGGRHRPPRPSDAVLRLPGLPCPPGLHRSGLSHVWSGPIAWGASPCCLRCRRAPSGWPRGTSSGPAGPATTRACGRATSRRRGPCRASSTR